MTITGLPLILFWVVLAVGTTTCLAGGMIVSGLCLGSAWDWICERFYR